MSRDGYERLRVEHRLLDQQAIRLSTESRAGFGLGQRAVQPPWRVSGDHSLPRLEARDAGTRRDDLTGAVGQRDQRKLQLGVVDALGDQEVPVVERDGAEADQDLSRTRGRT